MSRNNVIVIVIAIILIIICLIAINKKSDETIIDNENRTIKGVSYNEITNELTGEGGYIVYDKETGSEKTRVDEEYQLKIYETNPDYEELPVPKEQEEINQEDGNLEENITEN